MNHVLARLYIALVLGMSIWPFSVGAKKSIVEMASPQDAVSALPVLTPDQLEKSLELDTIERELDQQLNLEIDMVNSSVQKKRVEKRTGASQENAEKIITPTQVKKTTILEEVAKGGKKETVVVEEVAPKKEPAPAMPTPPKVEQTTKDQAHQKKSYAELIDQAGVPLELSPAIPMPTERSKKTTQAVDQEVDEEEARIEFNFEDADLENFLKYIGTIYDVTFITSDMLNPLPKNGKAIKGNKISFKTNKALSKKGAWNLFLSLLDLAGFAIVPEAEPFFYKVVQTETARKSALPAYIGVKPETLPENDQIIRFVYFVENANIQTIQGVIESLRSPASAFVVLSDLNGFLLTDKSYNIKSLMNIVTELDRSSLPQSMSVLKLRRADAQQVKALYDSIVQTDDATIAARLFPARRQPTTLYFPENTRIIAEPRTNSLILLGPVDAIKKIEDFIVSYVDVELGKLYSPLRVYQLKYADANTVAEIMTQVTQFGKNVPAGQFGGVRDEDKYLKNITFTPEASTNTIVVRGDEADFIRAKEIMDILDEAQPQIAMEILILSLDMTDLKALGTQMRSKNPGINGLVGPNVKFQDSGFLASGVPAGIVTNTGLGVDRLLGNLINLATNALPGNTLVSLGTDQFGIWGIFNILHSIINTQIISNPFVVTTNKKTAVVSVGETRRVVTGQTIGGGGPFNSFQNEAANLTVSVTPQINSDGMIVLTLDVNLESFVDQENKQSATKLTKQVTTSTIAADKEVLALGGLVQNKVISNTNKIPILGNIPLIGWLFKNRIKTNTKSNLLILMSTRIIEPNATQFTAPFTQDRLNSYQEDLIDMQEIPDKRDPIHRSFFADKPGTSDALMEDYLFKRHKGNKRKKQKATLAQQKKEPGLSTITKPALQLQPPQETIVPVAQSPLPDSYLQPRPAKRSMLDVFKEGEVR